MIRTLRLRAALPAVARRYRAMGTTAQLPDPEHAHGHLPSSTSPITSKLHFFNSVMGGGKQIPTYRVIDGAGQPLEGAVVPEVRLFLSSCTAREALNKPAIPRSTRPSLGGCESLPGLRQAIVLISALDTRTWSSYPSSMISSTTSSGKAASSSTYVTPYSISSSISLQCAR